MSIETLVERLETHATNRERFIEQATVEELVPLVGGSYLALEEVLDYSRAKGEQVAQAVQAEAERQEAAQRLARLDPDVGIAVCLAGIDTPEAAVALLPSVEVEVEPAQPARTDDDGTKHKATKARVEKQAPEWAVHDGYLFVRGVSSGEVAQALVATR